MLSLNHILKFGTTALAAFVLSACGSSGGNHDGAPSVNNQVQQTPPTPTKNPEVQPKPQIEISPTTTPNNQSQPPKVNIPANNVVQPNPQTGRETGAVLVASGRGDKASMHRVEMNNYTPKMSKINVEGTDVDIGIRGFTAKHWLNVLSGKKERRFDVCCGIYSDMRFGSNSDLIDKSHIYFFYNGNPTNDMPTTGTASYVGHAITSVDLNPLDHRDLYEGDSQFNVDFGNKTLNGILDIRNFHSDINATIAGNYFNGTANSSSVSSARVEGKFYGPQAKELAGFIQANDNSWGAAFGAQKQ